MQTSTAVATTDPSSAPAPSHDAGMPFDLYKDIHKAIRLELFGVTLAAGSLDPSVDAGRVELADRIAELVRLLVSHAEHEDAHLQHLVERHLPVLAHRIESDHVALDGRMLALGSLANAAADARAGVAARRRLHVLYLELASFTSDYLAHQDLEERHVMPGLCAAIALPELLDVHQRIVGSIPPDDLATSWALMFPAQNLDDRAEMLGGIQAGAPAEVFAGALALAQSVLAAEEWSALRTRLGIEA